MQSFHTLNQEPATKPPMASTAKGRANLRSLNHKLFVSALGVVLVLAFFTAITARNLLQLRHQANLLVAGTQRAAFAGGFEASIARAAGELATFAATNNATYLAEASDALERADQAQAGFQGLLGPKDALRTNELAGFAQSQAEILASIEFALRAVEGARAQGSRLDTPAMLDTIFAYEPAGEVLNHDLSGYLQAELTSQQRAVTSAATLAIASIAATVVSFLLLLLLLARMLRSSIVRPIEALSAAADHVAAGDLQHTVGITSSDEIGALQQSFNTMVQNLRQQHEALELRAEQLADAVGEAETARSFAENSNRAKSVFLATMSHELRTPLTAILGYAQLLRSDAQQLGHMGFESDLAKIELSGLQLLELINGVLDFSKIEAGRATLAIGEFDLAELIDQVITTIRPIVAQNYNQLNVELPAGLGSMCSDRTRVRQILLNLLGNAAKFTQNGSITLRAERTAPAGDWVEFTISDTGIGISNDQLPQLFQQFTQLDASRSRRYGGIGLGLTLSQRMCQLLGGTVAVQSQLGTGSIFTVRLPAAAPTRYDPTDTATPA